MRGSLNLDRSPFAVRRFCEFPMTTSLNANKKQAAAPEDPLRTRCRRRLRFLSAELMSSKAKRDVWQLLLTQGQRDEIGEGAFFRGRIEDSWMAIHGGSRANALLTIASHLGLLSEVDKLAFAKLGVRTGNADPKQNAQTQLGPHFCAEIGSLCYDGTELARFRIGPQPTHRERLLSAFETADWPQSIQSPWASASPAEDGLSPDVNVIVRHINDAIRKKCDRPPIHFGVRRGGESVIWELVNSADEAPSQRSGN